MYQRKRNWYMVWRQCKCNIDWTVLHNSRLCIKRKFHRNRCMRLAVAYCYPKNLRASGIRTRVVEVKYDIKISVRKICNWASFSVICWIRIEMCNDTEASLEADWEGYKSIWLSLNSPLWLCSYCNVSPTQNVVWSYTRYSSQCCIGAIAIPSTSSWTTTKQQCWTNKNVEYQWENGFIVWDYSPL